MYQVYILQSQVSNKYLNMYIPQGKIILRHRDPHLQGDLDKQISNVFAFKLNIIIKTGSNTLISANRFNGRSVLV